MLKLLVVSLAVGVAVGWLMRGRVRNLSTIQFRALPIVFLGAASGLAPLFFHMGLMPSRVLVVAGYISIALFLLLNVTQRSRMLVLGLGLLIAGWVCNAIPIALNGAMPLSLRAYYRAGFQEPPRPSEAGFFKVAIADEHTRVSIMGDVIPIRILNQVLSIGDILLMIGISVSVAGGMKSEHPRAHDAPRAHGGKDRPRYRLSKGGTV